MTIMVVLLVWRNYIAKMSLRQLIDLFHTSVLLMKKLADLSVFIQKKKNTLHQQQQKIN